MVGKGQPPKKPEDIKQNATVMFSASERQKIDDARETVNERFGQFVRRSAVERAEKINKKKQK